MDFVNFSLNTEREKYDFINQCESDFQTRLKEASLQVIKSRKRIVLLAGPTCSGKTTIAHQLIDDFNALGKKVSVVSFDDFFKDSMKKRNEGMEKPVDYDSIDVMDLDAIKDCVTQILSGGVAKIPSFDFITQTRTSTEEYRFLPDEIIIFEGIQAVYPQIYELFGGNAIGIFACVNQDVNYNGIRFDKNEIRLCRRIVRDRLFRGTNAEFSIFLWENVRKNEESSIFPNRFVCQVQIDTFMPYELFLLKPYLLKELKTVKNTSKYACEAEKLQEKLEAIKEEISYDMIPSNSLYTEFLGKK